LKVTVNGAEMRTVRVGDWTFRQADKVRQLTSTETEAGLLPGDILALLMREDPRAALAFTIVAYMLDGQDPSSLPDLSIEAIVLDTREEGDDTADPPEGGKKAAAPSRRAAKARAAKKPRRKS